MLKSLKNARREEERRRLGKTIIKRKTFPTKNVVWTIGACKVDNDRVHQIRRRLL